MIAGLLRWTKSNQQTTEPPSQTRGTTELSGQQESRPTLPGKDRTSQPQTAQACSSHIACVTSGIASSWPHSLASSADANHQMPITSALPNQGHLEER